MSLTTGRAIQEYSRYCNDLVWALKQSQRGVKGGKVQELREEIGERGKSDLHFFLVVILGHAYERLTGSARLHGEMCRHVAKVRSGVRPAVEAARGHFKSTIATKGRGLQRIVEDRDGSQLIASANQRLTKSFLRHMKNQIEGNETLRWVYPWLRPDRSKWSDLEFNVQRTKEGKLGSTEPTCTSGSVETGLTGGHFGAITYDDLVTEENVEPVEAALDVIETWKRWRPLLQLQGTEEIYVDTPYADYDLTAWLKENLPGYFEFKQWPAELEGGEPSFPEEFSKERLAELRAMDLGIYMAQYGLDPIPPELQWFHQADLQYFALDESEGERLFLPVVPETTRYLAIDSSSGTGGNECAAGVIGVDRREDFYVHEVLGGQWGIDELLETALNLATKWRVERIGFEAQGQSKSLLLLFRKEMERRDVWWEVQPLTTGEQKDRRVRITLAPMYKTKRIRHSLHLKGSEFEKQLLRYNPRSKMKDRVDAVTWGVHLGREHGYYGSAEVVEEQGSSGRYDHLYRLALTLEEMRQFDPEPELGLASALRQGLW